MKSKFEKYIEENRQGLDVEQPDDRHIWAGINRELNEKPVIRRFIFWKVAAIILLLFSTGYIVYNEFFRHEQKACTLSLSEISPEYAEMEVGFQMVIDSRMEKIKRINASDLEGFNMYIAELENLDEMCSEYQKDFYELGGNERLIRAMLDYYEKKMRILDRMLMEIQKQKDYEQRNEQIEL
jgi:hypothetical protein